MQQMWTKAQEKIAEGVSSSHIVGSYGKLCTRLILHVLKKEKSGREPKGFSTLTQIKELCEKDLASSQSNAEPRAKPRAATIETLEDCRDPKQNAFKQHKHLQIGELYTCSKYPGKIYKLDKCLETGFEFVHTPLLGVSQTSVTMPLKDDPDKEACKLSQWKPFKAEMPRKLTETTAMSFKPEHCPAFAEEIRRARLQLQVSEHFATSMRATDTDLLAFCCYPQSLCTSQRVTAKALQFYATGKLSEALAPGKPADLLRNIVLRDSASGSEYILQPPKQTVDWKAQDFAEAHKKFYLAPYFWVKPASKDEDANMTLGLEAVGDVYLPYFTNPKAIAVHQQLLYSTAQVKAAMEKALPEGKKRKANAITK